MVYLQRSHVILHEWRAFQSSFLNIHRSGVLNCPIATITTFFFKSSFFLRDNQMCNTTWRCAMHWSCMTRSGTNGSWWWPRRHRSNSVGSRPSPMSGGECVKTWRTVSDLMNINSWRFFVQHYISHTHCGFVYRQQSVSGCPSVHLSACLPVCEYIYVWVEWEETNAKRNRSYLVFLVN